MKNNVFMSYFRNLLILAKRSSSTLYSFLITSKILRFSWYCACFESTFKSSDVKAPMMKEYKKHPISIQITAKSLF